MLMGMLLRRDKMGLVIQRLEVFLRIGKDFVFFFNYVIFFWFF